MIIHGVINLNEFLTNKQDPSCGASVIFIGTVRNHHEGKKVSRLYYECYETMAKKQMQYILDAVKKRCAIHEARVLHRVGWLEVGEIAVVIIVNSSHRREAFEACHMIIDEIKSKVPIWKKEIYEDGHEAWVFCAHSEPVLYEQT